jgi:hypothetical protein
MPDMPSPADQKLQIRAQQQIPAKLATAVHSQAAQQAPRAHLLPMAQSLTCRAPPRQQFLPPLGPLAFSLPSSSLQSERLA